MTPLRERIYQVALEVPRGRVATYGDIARLAGNPGAARQVGWALSALPKGSPVPWWRIINREGAISCRAHGMELQARRLREEGIEVSSEGRIDLERHRWDG